MVVGSDVPESFLSSQSHKTFESEASQSHLKFFRFESEASHDLVESSKGGVTRTVESPRVMGLQARANVKANEIEHFSCVFSLLRIGAQHAMKWRPIS